MSVRRSVLYMKILTLYCLFGSYLQQFDTLRYHEQYLDKTFGYCEYKNGDYALNKRDKRISLLPKPILQNNILNELSKFNALVTHGTPLALHNTKILEDYFGENFRDFLRTAKVLGASFGVISSTLKYKLTTNNFSVDIMIEYIKQSLEAFTEEIVIRFEFLKNYLDDKSLDYERDVLLQKLIGLQKSWIDCATYEKDNEIDDCLMRKALVIDSYMPLYFIDEAEVLSAYVNKDVGKFSIQDIKKYEIHLLIVREYIFNYIVLFENAAVTQRLIKTKESDELFITLTAKLIDSLHRFKIYVKTVYQIITSAHTKNYCVASFKCKKPVDDNLKSARYTNCSCAFDETVSVQILSCFWLD